MKKKIRIYLSKLLIKLGNHIGGDLINELELKQSTIDFIKSINGKNKRNN